MNIHTNKTGTISGRETLNALVTGQNWTDFGDDMLMRANQVIYEKQESAGMIAINRKLHTLAARFNYHRAKPKREATQLKFIGANRKTGDSVDFMNTCFYSCSYCYASAAYAEKSKVQNSWSLDYNYLTITREHIFRQYLQARKNIIKSYPLRFFSLADCPTTHIPMLARLLEICNEEDTETMVISKNEDTIPTTSRLATAVLYSLDRGGYNAPTDITRYVELWKEYPKLRAFFMVIDLDDFRLYLDWIKKYQLTNFQFVAYHGQLFDTEDTPAPVKSAHTRLLKAGFLQILSQNELDKAVACCAPSKCVGCWFKCGVNPDTSVKFKLKQMET